MTNPAAEMQEAAAKVAEEVAQQARDRAENDVSGTPLFDREHAFRMQAATADRIAEQIHALHYDPEPMVARDVALKGAATAYVMGVAAGLAKNSEAIRNDITPLSWDELAEYANRFSEDNKCPTGETEDENRAANAALARAEQEAKEGKDA
jgi:hypothetical protein